MSKTFKHIYFDLDGTITDSFSGIENGIRFAFTAMNYEPLSSDQIKSIIGIPLHDSLKPFFNHDTLLVDEAVKLFRSYYDQHGIDQSVLYASIDQLLSKLSEHANLYIVTAKPSFFAKRLLENHDIAKYFTQVLGYSPELTNFTKADLIAQIGELENAMMVGDKKQDIDAGKAMRINTCAVAYGYGTMEEIEDSKPNYIVHSVDELMKLLLPDVSLAL